MAGPGLLKLRAVGDSMRPAVVPGEWLRVQPTTALRVGDVVAVIGVDGDIQAHRLIAIDSNHVWTRGDAAPWPDPPVGHDNVVGLVARGGSTGAAIARWPALAPLLGALGRAKQPADLPAAAVALGAALMVRAARALRR